MKYKNKTFKNNNYFILYDMEDNIICYFDNANELCNKTNLTINYLIREFNRNKSNTKIIIINEKKYRLATFC